MARVITERGRELLADLPPMYRDDPDIQAVITCYARESERVDDSIIELRNQLFPHLADTLLKAWEALVGTTLEPAGQTVEERRQLVLALLRRLRASAEGREWEDDVTALVGPGWSYEEHIPGDVTSPPADTLRIVLPFPPTSGSFAQIEAELRDITPAHVDLIVTSAGGFYLDSSQMDQEQMT